jgi:hypothetical protein
VPDVTRVVTVREPGSDFPQVGLPDQFTAERTKALQPRYPAVDQNKFHGATLDARKRAISYWPNHLFEQDLMERTTGSLDAAIYWTRVVRNIVLPTAFNFGVPAVTCYRLSGVSLSLSAMRLSSGSEPAFIFRIRRLRCTFTVSSVRLIGFEKVGNRHE